MENPIIFSLILLLPLLGAFLIGVGGFVSPGFRKNEKGIGLLASLMVAIPFFIILYAFINYHEPIHFGLFGASDSLSWMYSSSSRFGMNLFFDYRLDQLSLVMGLIVTGVGSLIHIYSVAYMHGDRGYYKFFLYLNLFIFAMLNLVLGNNLVVLFLGWEGVGACSYFLIGFWYEDMEKAKAAQKAFVANRIGDFAMICAMMILYANFHTVNLFDITLADGTVVNGLVPQLGALHGADAWLVPLLLFIAATGKSAQIPLFVWLPDAMAGPTPVSALIHAATMVTSGIYLIARMGVAYLAPDAETVRMVVAFGGAFTAILAALIAIAQNDIKKVLAYSTVSQLGFMFMALGAGAFTTAIFHVMTHAFFKACLFLGSGSVIHAMDHTHAVHDPQDIRTMGNLKKYMPATHITFFISTLAIAGIPGLAGFFSKDEILTMTFLNFMNGQSLYIAVWVIGLLTAAMTAFYMTRVYFLTFRGEERFALPKAGHGHGDHGHAKDAHHGHDDHGHGHGVHAPHESPALMTIPLYILAGLAVVGGYLGLPALFGHGTHQLNNWLGGHGGHEGIVTMHHYEALEHHASAGLEIVLILVSIAIAVGGVMVSWNLYKKNGIKGDTIVQKRLGKFYTHMENKFYVDELYQKTIIDPFVFIGRNVIMAFDKWVIDGIVNGIGSMMMFLGDTFKLLQLVLSATMPCSSLLA
ncbi:MAG: NADH-quinone oxidoreductase subunit L [Bacteroidia bacterium]